MDRIYNDNNSKLHRLMALSGAYSPMNNSPISLYNHPRRIPSFDSRANPHVISSIEDFESPIGRYYRSGQPLSAIENLEISPQSKLPKTLFNTPVKVEEDVLVMDGILLGPVAGGKVSRPSFSMSDSNGSSSSGGKSFYKTEICCSWEDFGSCRYGAKCQFAHGKEELRSARSSNKSKLEMCKSYSSGPSSCGSKCRFAHQQNNSPSSGADSPFTMTSLTSRTVSQNNSPESATDHQQINLPSSGTSPFTMTSLTSRTVSQNNSPESATDSPVSVIPSKTRTVSPAKLEKAMNVGEGSSLEARTVSPKKLQNAMNSSESSRITFASIDWSPLDDGIEIALPCSSCRTEKSPSKEEVDAYISGVLYGSSKRKTLPVFAAICPR